MTIDSKRHSVVLKVASSSGKSPRAAPGNVELTTLTSSPSRSPDTHLVPKTPPLASFQSMRITSQPPLWKRMSTGKLANTPPR